MMSCARPPLTDALAAAIQHPKSKKKDKKLATENLTAALGQICELQPTAVQPAHWELWLMHLPLVADEEEGQKVHGQLLRLLQAQHPALTEPAKLTRALEVLAIVYKTDASTDEINAGTTALFVAAGAQLEQMAAGWTEKGKKRLKRIVRDAQSGK